MSFDRPELLLLLVAVPLLGRAPRPHRVHAAPFAWASGPEGGWARPAIARLAPVPRRAIALGVALWIVLAAAPVRVTPGTVPPARAVAVTVVLDVSGSMREGRTGATPLDRTRRAVLDLVEAGPGYRIGLVTFGADALTRLPPTDDVALLRDALSTAEVGVEAGGSAVGTALGLAIERLRDDPSPVRTVILVSDGADNAGPVAPGSALALAAEAGVQVHMIVPAVAGARSPEAAATLAAVRAAGGRVEVAEEGTDGIAGALARRIPPRPVAGPPERRAAGAGLVLPATLLLLLGATLRCTRLGGVG